MGTNEDQFDLDLSAVSEERVVIGKVKLSTENEPEKIVDVYSPNNQDYVRLMKLQRHAAKILPLVKKQEEGALTEMDAQQMADAVQVMEDLENAVRPLLDVPSDEELNIPPDRIGVFLQWILNKASANEASASNAEKKTKGDTSPTPSVTSSENTQPTA